MVLRICLWVSYECVGATIVPVGVTSVWALRLCLWVSYECACVTNVPVGELRVCLCHECACG